MESGSTVTGSSTCKEKLPKVQKASENEEIISKLPESLISRILSLLPTEEAVQTSILSKRWLYHWRSITKLDLNDKVFLSRRKKKKTGGKHDFINFVNRALLTRGSSVESFSLVIANEYDASLVNTWIASILNQNIKNLHVDSHRGLCFSALASHSLFKSFLLEELVLKLLYGAIKVPPIDLYFGHLKLLKLSGVRFTTIVSSGNHMSLCLPVLKKFEIRSCIWSSIKDVYLKAPLLESIFIERGLVSNEWLSCLIQFSALHLKEFTYCGYGMSQHITLSDPSSVFNASASITLDKHSERIPETLSCAFLLLKQFGQVKQLKFEGPEVLLTQTIVTGLPIFEMLCHLELGIVAGDILLGMLLKSPILETLLVKGISKFDEEKFDSANVPDCLKSTLKVVKFGSVHGLNHELCLAKFVMENGLVLERMSFSLVSEWLAKSKVMGEFKEMLYSFKKAFSFAIVEFSYE